ncbi:MAG TPA: TMEM175 family protein [Candidatus Acidoferrales bacterium]|nr:TMEM175 family protein [Candidatus Acidoferrales bacterium]
MTKRFSTETDRLEAFSDGVLAVIITIMVLELHPPSAGTLHSLIDIVPNLAIYALSFVFVGIYWNNHHHMLRASKGIDGAAMWANLHLLFWLSLVPFATAWLGREPGAIGPTVLYGSVLLLDAVAYTILQVTLVRVNGRDTPFAAAVAVDVKGRASLVLYVVAIVAAFFQPIVSEAIWIGVAVMWLVPDRRFEPIIDQADSTAPAEVRLR